MATKAMTKRKKKSLKEVHEYIWNKYVDEASTAEASEDEDALDDTEALGLLREHYARVDLESNKEFFFYGILLFEMAFEEEEHKLEYFIRARRIMQKYLAISGEEDWEALTDRIDDISEFLTDEGILAVVEAAGDVLLDPDLDIRAYLAERARFPEIPAGMVLISGGTFQSGEDKEEDTLEAFLMDVHPVTNADYGEFIEQTGYRKPKYWEDPRYNQPGQPVVGVSLNDAKKFADWRGREIPTEKQWEKASRGTDGRTYPWGNELKSSNAHFNLDPELAACPPVDQYPDEASPYGCLEMAGYVWEWTRSIYERGTKLRVLKGGSWADDERFIGCATRMWAKEREKQDNVGFRCCLNPD